jgi:hypothetical protein
VPSTIRDRRAKPLNHPLSPSEAQPETTRFETAQFEVAQFETAQFSSKPRSLSKSLLDAARAQVR